MIRKLLSSVVCSLLLVRAARAEEVQTLQVVVTAVSGNSVFLDQGAAAGIDVGQRVRLFPPGGQTLDAVVQSTSSNHTRADLPPGVPLPPVGTRGEVDIPIQPPSKEEGVVRREPTAPAPSTPEHAPWPAPDEWTSEMPLLAPTMRPRPEERAVEVTGRVYGHGLYTRDMASDPETDYAIGRAGIWMEATNPLRRGGRLLFAGESEYRDRSGGATDGAETDLRLDRLSYAIGGQEFTPYRAELGRFYSIYMPELGLIDGVEGALQLENGFRAGVGGGAYPPPPFNSHNIGDDVGFHGFVDYESDTPGRLAALLGYQKTWHYGDPDRDLIVGRVNSRPSDHWWLYGNVRADIYTSDDTVKGSGVQITEVWTQARYAPDTKKGASVGYSRYRWPELKREDFREVPADLVRDGYVDRLSAAAWFHPLEPVRVSARVDPWRDQDDDGVSGELAADWRGRGAHQLFLRVAGFGTAGTATDGHGFRVEGRGTVGKVDASLGYEWFRYELATGLNGVTELDRHIVRGQVSWGQGPYYCALSTDYYFGDADSSYTIGLHGVYRF